MNLKYLGDALDHWKGSVFEGLQNARILDDFHVDAMASDLIKWPIEDRLLYAKLLRVSSDQIVHHAIKLGDDRKGYFNEITCSGDLFLDPDTGIQTSPVNDARYFLLSGELLNLINADDMRIVAVYQHIRAQVTRIRVEAVLQFIRKQQNTFFCTSYESGTVALLFFGKNHTRIAAVTNYFRDLLGSHAQHRIGIWS